MKKKIFEHQLKSLPKKIRWCKSCVISNARPRLSFNNYGICFACENKDYKLKTDWKKRENELIKLLDKHRKNGVKWDVIVPSSGGKDSGYVAHQLKYKYGMNPLLVTWSPLKYTDIGITNFDNLNNSGFSNLKFSPNGILQSKLARLCLEELGDAFHVFVLGQAFFPINLACEMNIKLIIYGENGELEYGGDKNLFNKSHINLVNDSKWLSNYLKGDSSIDKLLSWGLKNKSYLNKKFFNDCDLKYHKPPSFEKLKKSGVDRYYYYSYFKKWLPQENYYYCIDNTGFKSKIDRSEGTYSKYASLDDKFDSFHYFFRYIKFGLGRCIDDAAHEIRDGHISREEGVTLVKKYDGEFPKQYFKEFLDYLEISDNQFWKIVDSWRFPNIWKKENNKWKLRFPIK